MSAAKTTAVDLVERVREQDERLTTIGCLCGNAASDIRAVRTILAMDDSSPELMQMAVAALSRIGWLADTAARLTGATHQMDAEFWMLDNDDMQDRIKEGLASLKGAGA